MKFPLMILLASALALVCKSWAQDPSLTPIPPIEPSVEVVIDRNFNGRDYKSILVRLGGDSSAERQEKTVLVMLSHLLKDYPDANYYRIGISRSVDSYWALNYDRDGRRIFFLYMDDHIKSSGWTNYIYPSDIRRGVCSNTSLKSLLAEFSSLSTRRQKYLNRSN